MESRNLDPIKTDRFLDSLRSLGMTSFVSLMTLRPTPGAFVVGGRRLQRSEKTPAIFRCLKQKPPTDWSGVILL